METGNQSFLKQLTNLWSRIGSGQQLIVVALALILFVAFAVWLGLAKQTAYALLYGQLEPADAGRIISQLQSSEVPYKLRDNGRSVYVPADKVDELRISLATEGFTPSSTTGYEILDKNQFTTSDALQRTNTIRAKEGELARTLMSLDEVAAARVHLTLPTPSPFITEQEKPIASVVLQLKRPGMTLDPKKVSAVQTFVAGAIGSMDPSNVTIIDQNMNLLTGPSLAQPGGLMPSQEEARRNYETERAADIRRLLERAYGLGKVAVSFSCVMDFDQVQSETLNYDPVAGTEHGVLLSEELTETSSKGESPTSGVPGTESNIPSYPAATGAPTQSDSSTETKNYQISSTHEMRTEAPGKLISSSVGVLIDKTGRDILPTEQTEVEQLIASAAGLNTTQGDSLTVAFRDFDTSLQTELAQEKAGIGGASRLNMWLSALIALAALGIFFVVLWNFRKPMEQAFVITATEAAEIPQPSVELPPTDPEVLERLRIREEIDRLIKEDPAAAAKVIKTWLQE
jgi:flagellar M-ring protein FliF